MKTIQKIIGGVRKVIKYTKYIMCAGDILAYAAWRLERVDKGESATPEDYAKWANENKD